MDIILAGLLTMDTSTALAKARRAKTSKGVATCGSTSKLPVHNHQSSDTGSSTDDQQGGDSLPPPAGGGATSRAVTSDANELTSPSQGVKHRRAPDDQAPGPSSVPTTQDPNPTRDPSSE